ncbi:MAG: hypothetical protein JWO56_2299 [Acidobacteria bacterium]|nr:hypothetical protein [Acidobacteriota bacterium]
MTLGMLHDQGRRRAPVLHALCESLCSLQSVEDGVSLQATLHGYADRRGRLSSTLHGYAGQARALMILPGARRRQHVVGSRLGAVTLQKSRDDAANQLE